MFLNSRLMFCMHKVDTFFSKCNALIQQHCSTKIVSYHTNETEAQSQSIRDSGRDMQELTKIGELIIGKVSFVIHFTLVPYQ